LKRSVALDGGAALSSTRGGTMSTSALAGLGGGFHAGTSGLLKRSSTSSTVPAQPHASLPSSAGFSAGSHGFALLPAAGAGGSADVSGAAHAALQVLNVVDRSAVKAQDVAPGLDRVAIASEGRGARVW
jgi:hypothetical protein